MAPESQVAHIAADERAPHTPTCTPEPHPLHTGIQTEAAGLPPQDNTPHTPTDESTNDEPSPSRASQVCAERTADPHTPKPTSDDRDSSTVNIAQSGTHAIARAVASEPSLRNDMPSPEEPPSSMSTADPHTPIPSSDQDANPDRLMVTDPPTKPQDRGEVAPNHRTEQIARGGRPSQELAGQVTATPPPPSEGSMAAPENITTPAAEAIQPGRTG